MPEQQPEWECQRCRLTSRNQGERCEHCRGRLWRDPLGSRVAGRRDMLRLGEAAAGVVDRVVETRRALIGPDELGDRMRDLTEHLLGQAQDRMSGHRPLGDEERQVPPLSAAAYARIVRFA